LGGVPARQHDGGSISALAARKDRAPVPSFFRFDSKSRITIFAWVNDENTLRSSGSKSDPYAVFQRMLERGHRSDDWAALPLETIKMRSKLAHRPYLRSSCFF
jgi:hypothetical protein